MTNARERLSLCVALCMLGLALRAWSQEGERELRYYVPYIRRHDLPVNLGPTGAWGYVARNRLVVKGVHPGSPAEGRLRNWDLIVGAAGRTFAADEDPRQAIGRAITEAEKTGSALALDVLRDGKRIRASIPMRRLGPYSPTWPFNCRKSRTILAEACRFVARHSVPDRGTTGHREFNALLLLASGEPRYLDIVRRTAYRLVDDPLSAGYQGWSRSFAGILLAEYYLATGDPTVLPKLQSLAKLTAAGQMLCGSWGHRMPWGGYGAVNQIGLMCFISLVLFREAGVEVDPAAIARSEQFFVKYAGKGWIPYGDHVPWRGHSGNGKNGSAAIVFDLLGGHERAVADFAKSVAASYRYREEGHTGAYFSFVWGPPGAFRAPRAMFHEFLNEQTWYYDLARTWDGGMVCQPNRENLSGRTPGLYTLRGPEWTTGGMALFLAVPAKRLRILGAPKGVFSRRPPPSLRRAFELWKAKKWTEAAALLRAALAKPNLAADERSYAQGLLDAHERMQRAIGLALKAVEDNARKGDVFLASEQLKALERLLGRQTPATARLARALAGEKVAAEIELGKRWYGARHAFVTNSRARRTMEALAKHSESYYGRLAAKALAHAPPLPPKPHWQTIAPAPGAGEPLWRCYQWDEGTPPAGWQMPGFDDTAWATSPPPIRQGRGKRSIWTKRHIAARLSFELRQSDFARLALMVNCPPGTEVYLNGYRVVEVISSPNRPPALLPLHDKAVELLRVGRNVLAVTAPRGRGAILEISLQAAKVAGK